MKLDELRNTIENPTADNWAKIDYIGYRPRFHMSGGANGVTTDLDTHHTLLTFRDDVNIQVAYGIDADFPGTASVQHHPRKFDWASEFLHNELGVRVVHFLYRGDIVDEVWVLSADGAWLPFPELAPTSDGFRSQFSGPSLRVARLLHSIDYPVDSDEAGTSCTSPDCRSSRIVVALAALLASLVALGISGMSVFSHTCRDAPRRPDRRR